MLWLWSATHCVPLKQSQFQPKHMERGWVVVLSGSKISPVPTSDAQDLAVWMSRLNCELRNAIVFGDPVLVAKIGGLLGQGASVLSTLGSSDDEMRSRGALGDGRFAPY